MTGTSVVTPVKTARFTVSKMPEPVQSKHNTMRYAGIGRRFAAFAIDLILSTLILLTLIVGVAFVIAVTGIKMGMDKAVTLETMKMSGYVIEGVGRWLYFAGMESSPWQATLGKRLLGFKVAPVREGSIHFVQASIRYFAKGLVVLTLGLGLFVAAFTPKRQALHDWVARCTLVRV